MKQENILPLPSGVVIALNYVVGNGSVGRCQLFRGAPTLAPLQPSHDALECQESL